ncbi:MAG TPA: ABC transporter permease [Urbifossiella sp.]|nr:ABC transporter permease [Urbifossiella sp.]
MRIGAYIQAFAGLFVPLVLLRSVRGIVAPRRSNALVSLSMPVVALFAALWLFILVNTAATFALKGFPPFENPPKLDPLTFSAIGGAIFRAMIGVLQTQALLSLPFDWLFFRSFENAPEKLLPFDRALKARMRLERSIYSLIGTLFVIGFSLLPLAALLVALPAVAPDEAVLSDSVRPVRTFWQRFYRRVFGAFAGIMVLIALLGFSIEAVSRVPLPEGGQLSALAKKIFGFTIVDCILPEMFLEKAPKDLPEGESWLTARELIDKRDLYQEAASRQNRNSEEQRDAAARLAEVERLIDERLPTSPRLKIMLNPEASRWLAKPIWTFLPPTLVQHWPFVFLLVYATDLLLLLLIGRVPLAYNIRYLWVRRRDTALTALAFTVVVALVVVLLAFVNGMYKLNESTGIPGNVLVLADGATDEIFSNLGYSGGITNVEKEEVALDEKGRPVKTPYAVARGVIGPDGKLVELPAETPREKEPPGTLRLASFETYLVMNQPVPVAEGEKPRRRFLQVRAVKSPAIAAAVHNMELQPGGKWFAEDGNHQESGGKKIPCVIGAAAAGTLGGDAGKHQLQPGDTFSLGDREWIVLGVMKSEGTTFGSEVWCSAFNNPVLQASGKDNRPTTLVLRMAGNSEAASRAMAFHLQNRYGQAKVKAFSEPLYYQELTKTNEQFLTWIVFLAVVMAVGGVFGVMNTMFASIAARIKEVGVLRILGFKRWQILISFMLESLAIAFMGGLAGCALGYLANGFEASSTLSGGQGGGKSVALKMVVDYQTIAAGMLFTMVMGRLGGLVPALSAMRMEILDSLK